MKPPSTIVLRPLGRRCFKWCTIRPPVIMPLLEMITAGPVTLLSAFDSSVVRQR